MLLNAIKSEQNIDSMCLPPEVKKHHEISVQAILPYF